MWLLYKQFGNIVRELMRKKINIVFHARYHVYTRIKREKKSDRVRQKERRERIE